MGVPEVGSKTPSPPIYGLRKVLAVACLIPVAVAAVVLLETHSGHRHPPHPPGMVFRIETREVVSPMDRFEVYAVDRGGPAIAVAASSIDESPTTLRVYRYPDGHCIDEAIGPSAMQTAAKESSHAGKTDPVFDFDGDGVADSIVTGTGYPPGPLLERPTIRGPDYGVVRILSGRDGHLLFEDEDSLEYETADRAIPLGDLDGDGCAELALLHPRMNRSKYDLELWDWLFGAKSWVTVVSGARATR